MRNIRFDLRGIFLIVVGFLFMLGVAILAINLYSLISDNALFGNGAILGVFVSLVVIGVLIPSIIFTFVFKSWKK